jgi:hypothetical protein
MSHNQSQLNVYGRFYMQMHVAYKAQGSRLDFFSGNHFG